MLIDDFSNPGLLSALGARWYGVSDRVMGGVSQARVERTILADRPCLRLTGDVRLENNGGFVQAGLDLSPAGGVLDASGYAGIRLSVLGNGERYNLHLRTAATIRPWQSYRAHFDAGPDWTQIDLPFTGFKRHRLETALDTSLLRRIGIVAIGRAFAADVAVSGIEFYR